MKNKSSAILSTTLALAASLVMSVAYADNTNATNKTDGSTSAPVAKKAKKKTGKKSAAKKSANAASPARVEKVAMNSPTSGADSITTSAAAPSSGASVSAEAGKSVTDLKVNASSGILNNFGFRYDSAFYGPSVTTFGNHVPDQYNANVPWPIFLRNAFGAFYTLPNTKGVMVGATLRADVYPTGSNVKGAKNYNIDDSYFHLTSPKLIDRGNFSMLGAVRLYLPASSYSRQTGQSASVMVRAVPNYNIPNSRFSAGVIASYNTYTHQSWAKDYAIDNDAYFGPNVNYQLTPTVAVGVLYEMETVRFYKNQGFFDYTVNNDVNPTPTDIEPNVSWDITPNVNFNPYINLYPGSKFSLDTTSVGFYFGARLL